MVSSKAMDLTHIGKILDENSHFMKVKFWLLRYNLAGNRYLGYRQSETYYKLWEIGEIKASAKLTNCKKIKVVEVRPLSNYEWRVRESRKYTLSPLLWSFCSFVFNIVHKIAKRCVNKDVSRQFGIYYYFLEFLEESFGIHCTNVLTLTIVIVHVLDSC